VVGVCEEELKAAQQWNGSGVLNLMQTTAAFVFLLDSFYIICLSVLLAQLVKALAIPMHVPCCLSEVGSSNANKVNSGFHPFGVCEVNCGAVSLQLVTTTEDCSAGFPTD